ncbi:putative dynein intermediate chain [Trypanosoma rangeli]|uniref:Putative dynein intermediate chain n=1 Tax=Trypanosoma rangeli TaxID=5698 RepID=A0A3R7JXU8_TRYRA|nr:putative dynein intermediate chain [Trypanosoma rangeli]RNE97195.1 putative dynein intermediate chain [Trypanosoma rangeli]|eukprot:RNE97195.1 putative dynein intermediate chain [Trypanosoma rangeli]
MDLAAKRRQLEEIRAAREAKQRSVQQQLQQRKTESSQQKTSSTAFGRSSTSNSPMISVSGEPLQRAVSLVAHMQDEQHARELKTAPTAGTGRPRVLPAARLSFSEPPSKGSCYGSGGNAAVSGSEGDTWKVKMDIEAFAPRPTVAESKTGNCSQADTIPLAGVDTSLAVKLGVAGACATERLQEGEGRGKRRVMPTPDAAMMLVHSLLAESCVNCTDRCVLDVTLLDSNFSGGRSCGDGDGNGFLVAATLSEPYRAEEASKGASQFLSGRGGEAPLLSPSLFFTSMTAGDGGGGEVAARATAESVGEVRGLVLLWCILPGRNSDASYSVVPLCYDSEIRVLTYTRHRPHLLFGGASNGTVVAWRIDHALQGQSGAVLTAGSERLPMPPSSSGWLPTVSVSAALAPSEQSFPSPLTHQFRLLGMAVHGDANYHHLYTISQDGRVCMWAPPQLRLPTSSRDGVVSGQSLGCIGSCAAFVDKAADAMSKVVVGCLDGRVLEGRTKSSRVVEMSPINATSAAGNVLQRRSPTSRTSVEGPAHRAAVVVVAPHPLHADPRISDTLLTAAADGRCSLWLGARRVAIDGFVAQVNCLRWSPTHPAVFVAGESNGRVAVWDLSRSSCSPVASLYLQSVPPTAGWARTPPAASAAHVFASRSTAVTTLAFSDDGAWLSCGTSSGVVHLLRLRPDLALESSATAASKGDGDDAATAAAAASSWIDARFVF